MNAHELTMLRAANERAQRISLALDDLRDALREAPGDEICETAHDSLSSYLFTIESATNEVLRWTYEALATVHRDAQKGPR